MKQLRKRLTYANVMSSFAVFLVLGGATAFAATKIGSNQIKANAVKTGKIAKEAVTTSKLKNESVATTKIANGAVTTTKIADGAVTTAKIADKAVTGAKIDVAGLPQVPHAANANTVGGFAPSSLIRSAYAASEDDVSLTSDKTVLSATIDAPTGGFLLVTSSATWEASGANAFLHAGLELDNPGGSSWSSDDTRSISHQFGANTTQAGGPGARFQVGPGSHTVELNAHNDGSSTLSFRGGSLTVLFEPFGANG